MRMQVILDSSFARPGSAPTWGGKKGEFRDWTSASQNGIGVFSDRGRRTTNWLGPWKVPVVGKACHICQTSIPKSTVQLPYILDTI